MFIRIHGDDVKPDDARSHPDTVTVLLPPQFSGDNLTTSRSSARILIDMLATALNLTIVDPNAGIRDAEITTED